MSQALSILFYLKKTKTDKHGLAPIFLRTTVDGRRAEMSTHRSIDPDKWNPTGQCAKGNKEDSRNLNEYLIQMKNKVHKQYNTLQSDGVAITAEMLKDSVVGKSVKQHTLVEIFEYHNKQMWAKVGIDFAPGTAKHYDVTLRKIKSFLQHHFKRADIPMPEIKHQFITEFEFYLKTNDGCEHNTAIKHIKRLKKVMRLALSNEWTDKNLFLSYKCTTEKIERPYLTEEEIKCVAAKHFSIPRLEIVKDIFILSCYTGLSQTDLHSLKPSDIIIGIDGKKWIDILRNKTGVRCQIPLFLPALEIIEKYKSFPENMAVGKVLPVKSNQKMNSYLKEIIDQCGITKNITMHCGRHSFGNLMAAKGISRESIQVMMGHDDIRTTGQYSHVATHRISAEASQIYEGYEMPEKNKKVINK